jgi:hypothetical protein
MSGNTFDMFIMETLLIGDLKPHQELEALIQWDSMSQLVIAARIHQETGHLVSIEELKSAKTIGDLKAIYVSKL